MKTFVVRIWDGDEAGSKLPLRGVVEPVPDGTTTRFMHEAELIAVLRGVEGQVALEPPPHELAEHGPAKNRAANEEG